jgi:hypothetical protein
LLLCRLDGRNFGFNLSIIFSFGLTVFQIPAQQQAVIVMCHTKNHKPAEIDQTLPKREKYDLQKDT